MIIWTCPHHGLCSDVGHLGRCKDECLVRLGYKKKKDLVEVVRCKDCKHKTVTSDGMVCECALPTKTMKDYYIYGSMILARVEPDAFCSSGERKTMREWLIERMTALYGGAPMYEEIQKLHRYCNKIGVISTLEEFFDGFALRFPNGGDFVQHFGSYGSMAGYVEPAIGCKVDYTAVSLDSAKRLVKRHKERLNTGRQDDAD